MGVKMKSSHASFSWIASISLMLAMALGGSELRAASSNLALVAG